MIVRIEQDSAKHVNFYEGEHVGFHQEKMDGKICLALSIVIEGKNSVTIEATPSTRVFLMNDAGKTIDKFYC